MSLDPFRTTQWSCVAVVAMGMMPWALLVGSLLVRAIDSASPLTMSVVTWVVLLVPLWVAWFGALAWRHRNETAAPALIMAAPILLITALFMLIPSSVASP